MKHKVVNTDVKKKYVVQRTVVCIGLVLMVWLVFFWGYKHISRLNDLKNMVEDDFSFAFQVDAVKKEGKFFVLEGWAFKLGKNAEKGNMEILLYDILEDRIIYPKTEFVSREDVNEYFLCEYNYAACGMVSRFDVKELDIDGKNYEVLVSDKISRSVYQTETYLCKGELVYCTPIYEKLQVEGTGLEKIVNDGILRVFRPDVGMYVYQYEGDLYWIADLKYEFDNNNSTYIQYQMNTTQIQKLPDDRLKNGWTWGNEGFTFEDNEMELMGEWRVAKCSLPGEYSVTEIWTGYYMGEWVWKQSFRPYYIKD